jgi:sulfoxide reductase heme-binding subunit YedZ
VLILNGWARWSLAGFFGYEFVPQLGRTARMEPGFGLSNLLGLLAMMWTLVLVATSTDWAVRRLGPRAWKWLHNATHTVFWLVTAHVAYFLFIHYTLSFHREPLPTDWFQLPFLGLAAVVVILQVAAFVVTSRRQRQAQSRAPAMRSAGA